jgi:hypothetical protein
MAMYTHKSKSEHQHSHLKAKWVDNIATSLMGKRYGDAQWIHHDQYRFQRCNLANVLVNSVTKAVFSY